MSEEIQQQDQQADESPQQSETRPELPGKRLKAAREESRLSREEVAHHLRLDVKLITALEEDDYDKLPSPSYICGYLRSYARLLKLPDDELVRSYSLGQEISSALLPENVDIVTKRQASMSSLLPVIILLVILAIVLAGLWMAGLFDDKTTSRTTSSTHDDSRTTQQVIVVPVTEESPLAGSELQVEEQSSITTAPATEPNEITEFKKENELTQERIANVPKDPVTQNSKKGLRMVFRAASWTEVNDAQGNRLVYRLVNKGSDLSLEGEPPYVILLGNAPEVEVFYNGKRFDHQQYHRENIAYFRIGTSN